MFDRVQAGAGREHPAGEDTAPLPLQRYFVDLDKAISIGRFSWWARVTDPRRHLQRAKLHGLVDSDVERDGATRDLVETGEHRRWIGKLLGGRFGDNFVTGLKIGVGRLRRPVRALTRRLTGRRPKCLGPRLHRLLVLREVAWLGTRRRWQGFRLDAGWRVSVGRRPVWRRAARIIGALGGVWIIAWAKSGAPGRVARRLRAGHIGRRSGSIVHDPAKLGRSHSNAHRREGDGEQNTDESGSDHRGRSDLPGSANDSEHPSFGSVNTSIAAAEGREHARPRGASTDASPADCAG